MSYPLDEAAQDATLDAMFGDDAAATMPASFELALYAGDPALAGTELEADGGYARVTVANASSVFPAASSGVKVSAPIPFAAASGAWSDTATHYLLIDAADSTTRYFAGRLDDEVNVDDAGVVVTPTLRLLWNTSS